MKADLEREYLKFKIPVMILPATATGLHLTFDRTKELQSLVTTGSSRHADVLLIIIHTFIQTHGCVCIIKFYTRQEVMSHGRQ